jgi:hypothetical protein
LTVVARMVRQFHEATETVTLTKALALPDVPTMSAPPSVEVVLHWEPYAAAEPARARDWCDRPPPSGQRETPSTSR